MTRTPSPPPGASRWTRIADGIYRRINGAGRPYYQVRVYRGLDPRTGRQIRENFVTETLDEAKAIKRREEDKKPRRRRLSGHTVASFAAWWITDFSPNQANRAESTIRHYAERVRPL